MYRWTVAVLVLAAACPPPAAARSRTADAVAAANAAKAAFHARNLPAPRPVEGAAAANRTLKVVVAAVLADGTLALHSPRGEPLGILDPLAIPEIVAKDRARFGGRKHLEPADLGPGQRLKLTFRGRSSEILRAKVLKDGAG